MKNVREQVDFCVAIDYLISYKIWNWVDDEISEKIWNQVGAQIYNPIKNKLYELS